jgi:glycerol-3-phosphate dehydrogenase
MDFLSKQRKTSYFKIMRKKQIERLKNETFDLLVIGGGCTGAGVLLDGQTRGLKCALVEKNDFASQTSSRSTKLIHGGVRYLEQALLNFNFSGFKMVGEALKERKWMLEAAPHLAWEIPTLIPIYNPLKILWYWAGMKLYDALAGKDNLTPSRWVSKKQALELVGNIKEKGLIGGVLYTDGQFDDARFGLEIILTAIEHGAAAANYVEVVSLNPPKVKDRITQQEWTISCKHVVNATGPFVDEIRKLDDPTSTPLLSPSRGTHLVFEKGLLTGKTGILVPKTEDGRVFFILPWQEGTLVGTTDIACTPSFDPLPTEEEERYLLHHMNQVLQTAVYPEMIQAKFAGIRPLVGSKEKNTAKLSRDFYVEESKTSMLTITGGKWTTFRKMAEVVVDKICNKPCKTKEIAIHGKDRKKKREELNRQGFNTPLSEKFSYTEADVILALRDEMACTAEDILYRRTRLGVLDEKEALKALKRVDHLLQKQLHF